MQKTHPTVLVIITPAPSICLEPFTELLIERRSIGELSDAMKMNAKKEQQKANVTAGEIISLNLSADVVVKLRRRTVQVSNSPSSYLEPVAFRNAFV
jgi:hypothetical protein